MVLARSHYLAEVQHEVKVRGDELVVISLVDALQTSLFVDTAHMDARTDSGSEHAAHAHCADGRDEFVGFIVGKRNLSATLHAHKGIRIAFYFVLVHSLGKSGLYCQSGHHAGYQ